MSRLPDDDPVLPSDAAILRQLMAKRLRERPVHVGVALDCEPDSSRTSEDRRRQQDDCRIICDQEEPLRYI